MQTEDAFVERKRFRRRRAVFERGVMDRRRKEEREGDVRSSLRGRGGLRGREKEREDVKGHDHQTKQTTRARQMAGDGSDGHWRLSEETKKLDLSTSSR